MTRMTAAEMHLDSHPSSAQEARKFVARAVGASDPRCDLAVLLVSELATNVILHARTPFMVRVESTDDHVRCEVHDGVAVEAMRRRYSDDATTGRGLALVSELADDWGTSLAPDGKVVWFEVS